MPIRPKPFTFECCRCGWKKTVALRSDVLMPGEWVEHCPKCAAKPLKVRSAGWLERVLAEAWLRR